MMRKILTVGALAALVTGGTIEAIRFDQIKQKAVRSALVQTGLKAGMDQLEAAGVPVWSYFKTQNDFAPLIKAKRQGKDPLAVYWGMVDKNATRAEKERMNAGPAAAAAGAMGMDKYAGKMKAENYPYKLGQFADAMGIKRGQDLSKRAKAFLKRAKANDAFAKAYQIRDPYALNLINSGNLNRGWMPKIISNDRLIEYFNTQVLPADAVANVGPRASSEQLQDAIKQVFYVMNMHTQNIRQDAAAPQGGPNQLRDLLLTVTGVNDGGYRVSFVNGQGHFQHAFVPVAEVNLANNQPLKIGQLLVAKIDYAAGRQQQNFDSPMGDQLPNYSPNADLPAVNLVMFRANDRTQYDPIVAGSISKGLVPVR